MAARTGVVALTLVPTLVGVLGAAPATVLTGPDGLGPVGPPVRAGVAAVGARPSAPASRSDGAPQAAPSPLGTVAGVPLVVPPAARAAGFHQSGSRAALPMDRHPAHGELPSRSRGTAPTSAVDLAMPVGVPVTSIVTGTVVDSGPYTLYGHTPDLKVVVVPDANPQVHVIHLHLGNLLVHPGDRVIAGETKIAIEARQLPFPSQIDKVVGVGPHVHVEVRPF